MPSYALPAIAFSSSLAQASGATAAAILRSSPPHTGRSSVLFDSPPRRYLTTVLNTSVRVGAEPSSTPTSWQVRLTTPDNSLSYSYIPLSVLCAARLYLHSCHEPKRFIPCHQYCDCWLQELVAMSIKADSSRLDPAISFSGSSMTQKISDQNQPEPEAYLLQKYLSPQVLCRLMQSFVRSLSMQACFTSRPTAFSVRDHLLVVATVHPCLAFSQLWQDALQVNSLRHCHLPFPLPLTFPAYLSCPAPPVSLLERSQASRPYKLTI